MPALKVYQVLGFVLTTRPFAGDDLHIVCLILGTHRVLQSLCLIPLIINQLVQKMTGGNLIVNGYRKWCPQYTLGSYLLVHTVDEQQFQTITVDIFGSIFIWATIIFVFLDFTWILCVWSASSLGTPTASMGRDEYLRPLIIYKMLAVNVFPIVLLVLGIARVINLRKNNYGCGQEQPLYYPDETPIYSLFCILMVTFALELLVFPTIATNKVVHWIRRSKLVRKTYSTRSKGERLEQCLGYIFKCVAMCNKDLGGQDLKNKGEMKDFASNLMEFANNDAKVDITLSDIYVGGKLLARVQAERRYMTIQKLKESSNEGKDQDLAATTEENTVVESNRRSLLQSKTLSKYKQILTIQPKKNGQDYVVSEKRVLSSKNEEDVEVISTAAHYSLYALYIYMDIFDAALNDFGLPEDCQTFIRDLNTMLSPNNDSYRLKRIGCDHAHLCYANFSNGIAATPYAILVDEEKKTVVITIRGTLSLEDWVIDLQYVPLPLDEIGEICGFDGKGHHCHKGVLTRAKWLYNDIKVHKILKLLYSADSQYKEYNLVVVGHSLGGGCASVLSLMLRPSFPNLKCYAFEPPGCIFDDRLSGDCNDFITAVIRHDDVVPRVTQPNLELLRDEFFDVLARIKVPKLQAFRDVRTTVNSSHLIQRNAKMLCPRREIERDTPFYGQVRKFRTERAAKNQTGEVSVKLYIPGRIVHLVDAKGDEKGYIPYWASRYEFNQVVISATMLSDHSMIPLPDILQDLNLDNVHEEDTLGIKDAQEDDVDPNFLKFMFCSYPNGLRVGLLVVSSLVALICSFLSNTICKFVTRDTIVLFPNSTTTPGMGISAGIYSYTLKQCPRLDTSCEETLPNELDDSKYCQPYPSTFFIDQYWTAARICSIISFILALVGLAVVSLATCTKMKRKRWKYFSLIFLMASFFQGLQFLIFQSGLCNVMSFPVEGYDAVADCSFAKGAYMSIAALCLHFITAVGCITMLRKKQESS